MTRLYTSQLSLIRRCAAQAGIDEQTFNDRFITNFNHAYQHRQTTAVVTFDTIYYLAEKDTWDQICPGVDFPGSDPRTKTSYEPHLAQLFEKARRENGMDEADIQRQWMRCLDEAGKTWMTLGMEVVQYEAEKAFWELSWSSQGSFEGKDPRKVDTSWTKLMEEKVWILHQ